MSKQALSKTILAVVVLLMASSVSKTFAQTLVTPASHHILSAGDPGGFIPDPTGDGN